jgi:ATP/maltotriose-dependent transcriptional regulator MalT
MNDINEPTFQTEPEVPTIATFSRGVEVKRSDEFGNSHDIRVLGSTQEQDRKEYFADIEHRSNRAAEFEAKRQQVKPKEIKVESSVLDEVLNAVEAAAEDFEQSYGKTNQPLIDAKIEADHLRRELAEAEARLAKLEAKGDSVQRLKNALTVAEAQLLELRSTAESEEILRLAAEHYGWAIPWNRIGDEMKRDFRNHASVLAFKEFFVAASRNVTDPTELRGRLQIVGQKLVALREHLEKCAKTPGFNS